MRLKIAAATLLALGTVAGTAGTAEARDGCGPGFHRGWSGWCKPNWRPYAYRPVIYARPVVYRSYGYGWRRPWGYRHVGFGRPWGYRHVGYARPWGYRHVGWRGGYGGWHHRW